MKKIHNYVLEPTPVRRSDRNGGIKVVCIFQAITGKPTKLAYFKTMDLNGKNS